ncbi:MAG: alpha/beta hydrolase [Candidatus Accumulibacter meliphilus]|jgi:esterase/lipase superfamily enzyme|uniref:Alpha/beta hydrolase n=1 Tax=Candidatus Accumulibacter meliphilus TaxID=2211374 RepID=A0A369XH37_9PROT|nr:MAG: alpha/beta hydrolase [Candidatus Accumulibacter meliphilus]
MRQILVRTLATVLSALLIGGCATSARQLMPTPTLYQRPDRQPVFDPSPAARQSPDVDLLFITDRAPPTAAEIAEQGKDAGPLPYGQERGRRIAYGTALVRVVPALDWETLREQSQLAERTREVNLELGQVQELGAFPREPYQISRGPGGKILRDRAELARHFESKAAFQDEVQRRLAQAPKKEILLYVHGFNETFATAAYTAAELCHFLGREQVCTFFTWPASSRGNFLTSYTTTTESAEYAVEHLKKSIRMLATTPGVEGLQILAHSRGTALTLRAVRELANEALAAGKEPADLTKIDNLVLLSPDIDVDIAGQEITSYLSDPDLATVWSEGRIPRVLKGRLTIYASPEDRALRVSQLLFRSRHRVGQLRPEDIPEPIQRHFEMTGRIDLISYEGERTDRFGHSYFTTSPEVSSDLIELIRYGKQLGEPGRELIKTGRVSWVFPVNGDDGKQVSPH